MSARATHATRPTSDGNSARGAGVFALRICCQMRVVLTLIANTVAAAKVAAPRAQLALARISKKSRRACVFASAARGQEFICLALNADILANALITASAACANHLSYSIFGRFAKHARWNHASTGAIWKKIRMLPALDAYILVGTAIATPTAASTWLGRAGAIWKNHCVVLALNADVFVLASLAMLTAKCDGLPFPVFRSFAVSATRDGVGASAVRK